MVATTVVEHHANLLPWARVAQRRWVECGTEGTFSVDDVIAVLDDGRPPALLAMTGASNVTGWLPPVEEICAAAHERGIPVLLDAAQLAPHRPLPPWPDYVAFSGHKLYAPFGAGALIGPRRTFEEGDPFLAGGGAVDLVDLDEVIWTDPPEREEAGSPNVVGAVAFGAAMDELERIGWATIQAHEAVLAGQLLDGLRAIDGGVLGPAAPTTLAGAALTSAGPPAPQPPRPAPLPPWPWPPSSSRACITHWWRRGSARNTASASVTAASAPIPISSACSASVATVSTKPARPCAGAIAAASPGRCGPVAGSARPPTTSPRCSVR